MGIPWGNWPWTPTRLIRIWPTVSIASPCWAGPRDAAAVAAAYAQGFADGRDKSFLELEAWRPADHVRGCGCRLCTVARGIVNQVLDQQAWK